MSIDLKPVRELLKLVRNSDVEEIEVESEGQRIRIRRSAHASAVRSESAPTLDHEVVPTGAFSSGPPMPATLRPPPPPEVGEHLSSDEAFITSPFVGTFYRASNPDAAAFAEPGKEVRKGQPLCIVEAMKLMNEIEADFACVILEVLATNGKPVEYGDKLFRVRKLG